MRGNRSGVSRRIFDINPRATYIHCQAHQLNLVLVDSCKRNSSASEFSLLESLYVFMASSISHSIFMSKQSEHGFKQKVHLKPLSDTRWSCRHASIVSIKSTISVIYDSLDEIIEGNDSNRVIQARGLLLQVTFVVSLLLFEKLFSITGKLSDLLQAETLSYAAAARCITATKQTLRDIRAEEEWSAIWAEAVRNITFL